MKRYLNRFDIPDEDRHAALEHLLRTVRADPSIPARIQAWVIDGLSAVLDQPGLTLDEALGFRPRRGKHRFHEAHKRKLIRELAAIFGGTRMNQAAGAAAVLRGELAPACEKGRGLLAELRRFSRVPQSPRRILSLLADGG